MAVPRKAPIVDDAEQDALSPVKVIALQNRSAYRSWLNSEFLSPLTLLSAAFCLIYAYFFWDRISAYWFHPEWTTDDALQQIYPFHKALKPKLFHADLITTMMECYLAPLHYWICYGITLLTKSPIMMGHWVMLIQLLLSAGFVFAAVRFAAGVLPAFLAVVWLLHTRHIMQRLTAGLPRGWAAPVIAAYLYFVLKGNHRAILLTILIGCLLHPPSTLMIALSYGLLLLWRVARPTTRAENVRPLLTYLMVSPIFVLVTYSVVRMPPEIGRMASYEVASQMPEFQFPKGRFPFVPLREATGEIRSFGFQAFIGRFYNPGKFAKRYMPEIVVGLVLGLVLFGIKRKRLIIPMELWTFLLATISVYFASRVFAFRLYVPNRHLQFPLGFFFVIALSIAVWRVLYAGPFRLEGNKFLTSGNFRSTITPSIGMLLLGALVVWGSGAGLNGAANFNYSLTKKGSVWKWVRDNTPQDALIGGDPTHIDGAQLFGERAAYVTTETSHPFYDKYATEMRRRLEIALRAHYAHDLGELVKILEPTGIDYFIFERRKFYPSALANAYYFPPLDGLVKELAARPVREYAYRQLPQEANVEEFPAMPFKDKYSAVVDVKQLKSYLTLHPALATSFPEVPGETEPSDAKKERQEEFSRELDD